jgi:hypothetical protein
LPLGIPLALPFRETFWSERRSGVKTKYQRKLSQIVLSTALLLVFPAMALARTGDNTNQVRADLGTYGRGVDDFGLGGFAIYSTPNDRFASRTGGQASTTGPTGNAGAHQPNSLTLGGAKKRSLEDFRGRKSKSHDESVGNRAIGHEGATIEQETARLHGSNFTTGKSAGSDTTGEVLDVAQLTVRRKGGNAFANLSTPTSEQDASEWFSLEHTGRSDCPNGFDSCRNPSRSENLKGNRHALRIDHPSISGDYYPAAKDHQNEYGNGRPHSLPEPATLLLLASGLVGLAAIVKRGRRQVL